MKIICCGVEYKTTDPDTWWCFQKYITGSLLKNEVCGKKVVKEEVFVLLCKKNNCTKVQILRYGEPDQANGGCIKKTIETECFSKKAAIHFLRENVHNLHKIKIEPPGKLFITGKKIPAVYGKVIDFETQKRQYIDESGSPDNILLKSPCKTWHLFWE